MKSISVSITGISPLLQHRFPVEPNKTPTHRKERDISDDVKSCLYVNPVGQIYQPSDHIRAAMQVAAKGIRVAGSGKSTYSKIFGSGAVIVEPYEIVHKNQKYEVDARAVVVQKARIVRYRPVFNDWQLDFTIMYDDDMVTSAVIRTALDYAGSRVGIGDYRPDKGGSFGRFRIDKYEEA